MTRKIRNSNISTGTITAASLTDTGVTAGNYGSSTAIPVLTVNAKGQIVTASTASLPANLATETYVSNAIAALVDSSPSALDTLNELAAALGDDSNFATTVTNSLATKVDKINITGATVGSATQIPVITYNAQGQITGTTTAALDLSTKVDKINITGATVGTDTKIPRITYNDQGQITSAVEQSLGLGSLAYLNSVGTAQISGWEQSLSGTGYLKFPGGLIFQWTRSGGHSSESDYTQSFPITFPNACLRVIIGTEEPDGSRDAMWQLRSFNTSSVTARLNQLNGAGGTAYMNIFAIGY